MAVSDADRLLALGAPITINGESRRVRFGFRGLLYLEKEYGGLDVFYAKLMEQGFGATRIHTIFTGLVAGLLHSKPAEQELEVFEMELERALEPSQMLDYLNALIAAFIESIPQLERPSGPKANGSRGSSRGRTSTSMRPSATDAAMSNSGT